jgi:energy-coupling factor transport system ATP-binding protein
MAQSGNELIQPEPVTLEAVSYRYDEDSRQAVDGVSMAIGAGEFVAVLGHNGSGKSTLAKLMNALYLPTSGRVVVCGMDTAKEPQLWNIRKHAGMVFQNPDNQIVATVVREDVAFGLENIGMPREQMIDRIDDALDAVSMKDYAAAAPHMLSGGQKQRVAVAGVLAMQPDVMVMDEATAMLDPTGRKDIFDTTRRLNREKNITVVWITHFMEEAAMADRVIVLSDGKIAMNGTPQKVFSQVNKLRKLGLDVPPMAMLSSMLSRRGLKLPKGILTVDDMMKELKVCLSK